MSNYRQQSAAPMPVASDRPLIPETEMERTIRTERNYTLPEHERLALIEKYGAPTLPLKSKNRSGFMSMPQRRVKA